MIDKVTGFKINNEVGNYLIYKVSILTINKVGNNMIEKVANMTIDNAGNYLIFCIADMTINDARNSLKQEGASDAQIQFSDDPAGKLTNIY